jgi:hypothetical protein
MEQRSTAFYPFPLKEIRRLVKREWIFKYLPSGAVGAEIGVFRGHFSECILETLAPRVFYMVDPWTKAGPVFPWKDKKSEYLSGGELTTRAALDDAANRAARFTQSKVVLVEEYAQAFLEQLRRKIAAGEAEPLDFAYLDASHTYADTLAELLALESCMGPEGMIAGDDWAINPQGKHYGVCRAVHDFIRQTDWQIIAVGQVAQWIVRRTPQNAAGTKNEESV